MYIISQLAPHILATVNKTITTAEAPLFLDGVTVEG
jgi:hypothetical protein